MGEKIHFAFFILEFPMSYFFHETKSGIYFYQRSGIIVSYFELLRNYPKRPQRKSYEIQGVNRFSKFYFTKIKTVGTPLNLELNFDIQFIMNIQYIRLFKKEF